MSPDEADRLLAMAGNLKVHAMLALGYGCGLRAGEIVRLKVGDIDSAQMIIRVVQSRAAKTGMSCCRKKCSRCYANGGRHVPHATTRTCRSGSAGYFPGIGWESI
jgi:integrase